MTSTATIPASVDRAGLRNALDACERNRIPLRITVRSDDGIERVFCERGTIFSFGLCLVVAEEQAIKIVPLKFVTSLTRAGRGSRRIWPRPGRRGAP